MRGIVLGILWGEPHRRRVAWWPVRGGCRGFVGKDFLEEAALGLFMRQKALSRGWAEWNG